MKIGYARVSTYDQNLDLQINALQEVGCERIYQEKKSALSQRTELERLISYLREGDTLVVWKLDRLGRSLHELLHYFELFSKNNIALISLQDNIDTSSAVGKLFFQITGAFAEYERSIIVERTKAGLHAAREKGVMLGRRKGLTRASVLKAENALKLYQDNELSVREICKNVGITTATFYRYLQFLNHKPDRKVGLKKRNRGD